MTDPARSNSEKLKPGWVDAPTWLLRKPPSGCDGRRWSAAWFVPTAVEAWGLEHPAVQRAVAKLQADGFVRDEVRPIQRPGSRLALLITGLREESTTDIAYDKPTRQVELKHQNPLTRRLRAYLALEGPLAPVDVEDQGLRRQDVVRAPAEREEMYRARQPLVARELIRVSSAKTREGGCAPIRRDLLAEVKRSGLQYRVPHQAGPAFTDMSPAELQRVVEEAQRLVDLVRAQPGEFWPLLPREVDRLRRPPPAHRPYSDRGDYEDALREYPDEVRSSKVLARDLTLLRLGYSPDDGDDWYRASAALRAQLSRVG